MQNHWLTHPKQIFVFICLNSFITSAISLTKDIDSFLSNIISEVLKKNNNKIVQYENFFKKSLCYSLQNGKAIVPHSLTAFAVSYSKLQK